MPDMTPPVGLWTVALHGVCPRCGVGKIFRGLLEFAETCPQCQLDLRAHDNGDGPAFFVIIVVGFLVTGLAGWTEFAYSPPFWVHALLWAPLILILSIGLLRLFKAMLLASQYKHKRMDGSGDDGV